MGGQVEKPQQQQQQVKATKDQQAAETGDNNTEFQAIISSPNCSSVLAHVDEAQVKLTKFASLIPSQDDQQTVVDEPHVDGRLAAAAPIKMITAEGGRRPKSHDYDEQPQRGGRVSSSSGGEAAPSKLSRASSLSTVATTIGHSQQTSTTNLTGDPVEPTDAHQHHQLAANLNMMAKYHRISFRGKESAAAAGPKGVDVHKNIEPFKIVWRNLTFQVQQSAYEQVLGQAAATAQRLFRLGRPKTHKGDVQGQSKAAAVDGANQNNVNVIDSSKSSSKSRVIFEDLNGCVKSGELSAILGPSGSGKTSLLNAICGRASDNYRGEIQLIVGNQDEDANHQNKKRRMRLSIIPQRDYLIENLTVRENLLYSSKILNTNQGFDHEENILRVAKMLNLGTCFESNVINISGGEYKRVSIAQELLKRPDILILDEPTSGLDSLNCRKLVASLVQLIEASRRGDIDRIAIIMTIHQPDIDVFNMFDHVYCMAKGGRVIYDGRPRESMQALRSSGAFELDKVPQELASSELQVDKMGAGQLQLGANPANLLIEIASEEVYGSEPIERLARLQRKQFEHSIGGGGGSGPKQQMQPPTDKLEPPSKHPIIEQFQIEMQDIEQKRQQTPTNTLSSDCSSSMSNSSSQQAKDKKHNTNNNKRMLIRDKRLNVKNDHSGHFFYHTSLLAKRAFASTLRDPLMTVMSLMFHLTIPFVMWTVYPRRIGTVRVCPVVNREMDVLSMANNRTFERLESLQEELTISVECSTMFFLTTYAFSMCSLGVAALAFPLSMHILLKEVRNGWYNLPSFVLGKTLANIPFEVILPVVSLTMVYLMLDMPGSFVEWRLWAMALVVAIMSMISHNLGLIFGAICMDSVQTAIFLATGFSLPLVLLSGFTARIKNMPVVLQKLSWLSPYRYTSDLINMIRFGFGICPCDEATDEYLHSKTPQFTDIPAQMKPLFGFYLTNTANTQNEDDTTSEILSNSTTAISNATTSATFQAVDRVVGINYDMLLNASERKQIIARFESNEVDLFGQMADMVARSFSYGRKITGCESVRSHVLEICGTPPDDYLPLMLGCMFGLLLLTKVILFIVVKVKIGSRI